MKKISLLLVFFAALGALCAAFSFIFLMNKDRRRELTCGGVRVEFADSCSFVSQKDVEGYLKKEYGACIGQRLDSVDLRKVERILDAKSAVLRTEAFTTPDGYLNVRIHQRVPAVRFRKGDTGFFADERGFLFPEQGGSHLHVPVIEGDVPLAFSPGSKGEPQTEKEREWLAGILALTDYMNRSGVWARNIAGITADREGNLVMTPRKGKERFLFGKPVEIEDKFRRIGAYYTAVVPEKGADFYATVNVKYRKQIVCRK